jgi:RimJ/RimL family protein N-acetyltransferase
MLRRFRASDLVAFQAYRALPELGRYQGWSPMGEVEAAAFLAEMGVAPLFALGEWVQLAIANPSGERLVGDIGVFVAEDQSHAEIGFTLEPGVQGRGVATAAVREAIGLLFESMRITRVLGITDSRNLASIRLLERAGFRLQDSRHTMFRGEPCVEHVYVLPRPTTRRRLTPGARTDC